MLRIYNSQTKAKADFKPIRDDEVSIYVCGQTVYDYCHMGHARSNIAFDVAVRYMRFLGFNVRYVQNITDVDDKIIKRANENGETCEALTKRFTEAMNEDFARLYIMPADKAPCATHYVDKMIEMIQSLIDKKFAYVAKNGDVVYDVSAFEGYGKLSHRKLDEMQAGSRVEVDDNKDDPFDFLLWKMAKPDEPAWDSPWGQGRPGWHLECSVMSSECLHEHIDIHGGGMDLKFPHHENEIAQSEAAHGHTFVNTWMHAGFLNINDEKMSKSLGNFFLIRDALEKFSGEQIRFFMLSSHYRKPVNYSERNLAQADEGLTRLYTALRDLKPQSGLADSPYETAFRKAMDDDFNTPDAIAVLFDLARHINKLKSTDQAAASQHAALLKRLAAVLGLLPDTPETFFQATGQVDASSVEKLIAERQAARLEKDWARADHARAQLDALGVIVEDSAGSTSWRFK
jgi:cysteinyl-tRNA synthetase